MKEQSLYTYERTIKDERNHVVYSLTFKNALYSLESYKEDLDEPEKHYCYIENLTDDEGEAETFQKMLVKGKVSPLHIKDFVIDYFGR